MADTPKRGWLLYRENRVPYYQRLYQKHDDPHIRQWRKTPRSKLILYPYYVLLSVSFGASMFGMIRMVMGHKTFFGKD